MLHSAPYRTCVSRPLYTGERRILFYFSTKHRGKTACFPVKRHLGHSSSDLSSRPPEPHLSFTHTNRESGSIGPRNSFKYEELNACTREKEKIIELIRSNHLINLHADQFSRSIIGRCSSSEGVSGKQSQTRSFVV